MHDTHEFNRMHAHKDTHNGDPCINCKCPADYPQWWWVISHDFKELSELEEEHSQTMHTNTHSVGWRAASWLEGCYAIN